jgi:hypothetical protein
VQQTASRQQHTNANPFNPYGGAPQIIRITQKGPDSGLSLRQSPAGGFRPPLC